ncbi:MULTISPECIES: hypothetical protein [unclassified Ruegeria]|uniref:hypothetical protein n=1 Tax=unclassified Ruegeria TaxID=2625375 RepID=UPI001488A958|nr:MULTISPECIES: hypothetical protein [unclassified Ruegeria]
MPAKLPRWKSAVGGANSQSCSYRLSGTAAGSKDRFGLPAVIVLGDGSGGFDPVWIVGEGCGESAVSVRVKSTPANDRFDDMRCIATMGALRVRIDAASAKAKSPMSGIVRRADILRDFANVCLEPILSDAARRMNVRHRIFNRWSGDKSQLFVGGCRYIFFP